MSSDNQLNYGLDTDTIDIADSVYEYLISEDIHFDRYDHKNRFAD